MSFIDELKRRNVLRVGAAYVVTAWLIVQVAETLFPIYGFSADSIRLVVNILAVGLVPVLVLAWVFEWTPDGLKRDSQLESHAPDSEAAAKRLDRIILVVLALALGYFAFDKFVLSESREAAIAERARLEGRSEAIVESFGAQSIAVLAFADMSPDKDQEYLSDGIAEEILHLLEKIDGLRVISRTSAFSYKGKNVPMPMIAEQLNVAHILEGSVRKAGDRIRVTVQLIDARSDTHLWSETFDRRLDDIFAIQDELAAAMVDQLQIELLGEAPQVRRIDPEAYLLWLQGNYFANYINPGKAAELLEQALAIEPDYVEALLGLSRVYWQLSESVGAAQSVPKDEFWHRANVVWERAKALDPQHPVVLAYLAWEALEKGDWTTAARCIEQALERDATHPDVILAAVIFSRNIGRNDLALAFSRDSLSRDPLCTTCNYQYSRALLNLDRFADAIEAMRKFKLIVPGHSGEGTLGTALMLLGDLEGARAVFEKRESGDRWWGLLMLRAWQGEDISSELKLLESQIPDQRFSVFQLAELYAVSGDIENAYRMLARGESLTVPYGRPLDSRFLVNLHDDPRWQGFLERAGLAPHQLAEIKFNPKLPD